MVAGYTTLRGIMFDKIRLRARRFAAFGVDDSELSESDCYELVCPPALRERVREVCHLADIRTTGVVQIGVVYDQRNYSRKGKAILNVLVSGQLAIPRGIEHGSWLAPDHPLMERFRQFVEARYEAGVFMATARSVFYHMWKSCSNQEFAYSFPDFISLVRETEMYKNKPMPLWVRQHDKLPSYYSQFGDDLKADIRFMKDTFATMRMIPDDFEPAMQNWSVQFPHMEHARDYGTVTFESV